MTAHPTRRSLVYELDSVEQARVWQEMASGGWADGRPDSVTPLEVRWIAGVLRAADLLSEEVLLLDSQLLDGCFFARTGPHMVRQVLGRLQDDDPGVCVVARQASLAECLRAMALGSHPETGVLANFEWSVLRCFGIDPATLTAGLHHRSNSRLSDCQSRDVPVLLAAELQSVHEGRELRGRPTGQFDRLARRWQEWIDAVEGGAFEVQTFDGGRFDLAEALSRRDPPSLVDDEPLLQDLIVHLREQRGRSTVFHTLEERRDDAAFPLTEGQARDLRSWWNSAYFDALARLHEANWVRLTPLAGSGGGGHDADERVRGATAIPVEGQIVEALAQMPPEVYSTARYAARRETRQWLLEPSENAAADLAYAIMRIADTPGRSETRARLLKQMAMVFVPAAAGVVTSALFDSATGLFVVVGLLILVLLAIPVTQLWELASLRTARMRAYINFPDGTHG